MPMRYHCDMVYDTKSDPIDPVNIFNENGNVCYMANLDNFQKVTCNGDCASSPTSAPTHSPTKAPTTDPTNAPTHSPSNSPSKTPTAPPTNAPSNSPTNSPTKMPTEMDDFDSFVECEYKLSGLTIVDLKSIASELTDFSADSASLIHSGFDHDAHLEYHQIWVNVSGFNGHSLDILALDETKLFVNRDYITMQSFTLCPAAYCQVVSGESAAQSDTDNFTDFMTSVFQEYWTEFGGNRFPFPH